MLCPIGQSNEKPPLQAIAKWREYVTNIKRGHPGDETLQYDGDHLTEKTMPDSMKNVTGRFPKNHILKRIRGFFGEKDIILEDRSKKFIFIQK